MYYCVLIYFYIYWLYSYLKMLGLASDRRSVSVCPSAQRRLGRARTEAGVLTRVGVWKHPGWDLYGEAADKDCSGSSCLLSLSLYALRRWRRRVIPARGSLARANSGRWRESSSGDWRESRPSCLTRWGSKRENAFKETDIWRCQHDHLNLNLTTSWCTVWSLRKRSPRWRSCPCTGPYWWRLAIHPLYSHWILGWWDLPCKANSICINCATFHC